MSDSGPAARFLVPKSLTKDTIDAFKVEIWLLVEGGANVVALDFSDLEEFDLAALFALAATSKLMRDRGGLLLLDKVGQDLRDVIVRTALDVVFFMRTSTAAPEAHEAWDSEEDDDR